MVSSICATMMTLMRRRPLLPLLTLLWSSPVLCRSQKERYGAAFDAAKATRTLLAKQATIFTTASSSAAAFVASTTSMSPPRCSRKATVPPRRFVDAPIFAAVSSSSVSSFVSSARTNTAKATTATTTTTTALRMSLKPAAIPLLDSGKSLASSGETLIDLTSTLDLYGGALSSVGAQMRNAGDHLAQAAASCRFKTASEFVSDELREASCCLGEAAGKLVLAVEESESEMANKGREEGGGESKMAQTIGEAIKPMKAASIELEDAGAAIMKRLPVTDVGTALYQCGTYLSKVSTVLGSIATAAAEEEEGKGNEQGEGEAQAEECQRRMSFAAERMRIAGDELRNDPTVKARPKGKAWIKGG